MSKFFSAKCLIFIPLLTCVIGCTVHPPGEQQERDAAAKAATPFEKPFETRALPHLPDNPTPDQLVQYAFLASPQLEQHYWEWRSAIEQIPQDATQTTSLNLSAGAAITNRHAAWNNTTLGLSNDPMTDLKWPGKLDAAASQALEDAKAAGQRFITAKYDLRNKVLQAYDDYALNAELIRLEQANLQLLKTTATVTESQDRAGNSAQQDVLRAGNELDLSANDLATIKSQLLTRRAAINALLNRPMDAPLAIPTSLPATRPLAYDDQEVIELAAKQSPQLIALSDEIHARTDAVTLAKFQYLPDFNLSAATDLVGITQSLLGQATIPLFRHQALDAAIAQAQDNLQASQAMRRQSGDDLAAQVAADLATIHDADRQLDFFQQTILPRTRLMVTVGQSAFETGQSSLLDLLNDQRSLIDTQRLIANLKIAREKQLADLESFTASDLSNPP